MLLARELLTAADRDEINIEVAFSIAGKGDRLTVGREPGREIARLVGSETGDFLAILAGGPDIAQVAERNLPLMIVRRANDLRFARRDMAGEPETDAQGQGERSLSGHGDDS